MLEIIIDLVSFVIKTTVLVAVLYFVADLVGWVPKQYAPGVVFATQNAQIKNFLKRDASSNGMTAGVSKMAYDFLYTNANAASTPPAPTPTPAPANNTDTYVNPIDKAKATVQEYQNSINQEKQQLDNL